jgi:DNA-binding transcriptional LysR family regulator
MNTIQNLRVFVRVVEAGSFTAAAQSLNSATGVVSRAVSELEAHLRTRLLNRSTRRLSLTPAGERYLRRCQQILADVDNAEEEASGAREHPAGTLRIFSYASIGQHYVLPAISRYRAQYFEETKLPRVKIGDEAEMRLMSGGVLQGRVESISLGIYDRDNPESRELLADVDPTFNWVR